MAEGEKETLHNIFEFTGSIGASGLNDSAEGNIIFSPLLLQKFLSLLSQSRTYYYKDSFKTTLSYNSPELYIQCYKNYISSLHSLDCDIFSLASKLLIKDKYKLQEDFKDLINNLNQEIEASDENIDNQVNSWIETRTNGLIKNKLDGSLNENVPLVLLDAVRFKAKWDAALNFESVPKTFHLSETDSMEAEMLEFKGEFSYKFDEYEFAAVLELPLASEEFSLILVLPDDSSAFDWTNLLWDFPTATEYMTKETVEVSLPRFRIEGLQNCRNNISELYLREDFKNSPYLFDILQSDDFIKFDRIDEKAFISLDENGIEAASGFTVTMVPAELDYEANSPDGLNMSELSVKTDITNRYSKTLVTYKIENDDNSVKETTITFTFPEEALVTDFIIEMNNKSYKSCIKDAYEAETIDGKKVIQNNRAEFVEASTRDSTQFNVTVDLPPKSVAAFLLTYEQLLQRVEDQYELVLNICPGRILNNIYVEVNINESKPLKFVRVAPLRSGNEVKNRIEKFLIPHSEIKIVNENSSVVKYTADRKQLQKFSYYLETPPSKGFVGQFVVQYDVERHPKEGELLLQDGYFTHFFAPTELDALPKHVVFVLDTSCSKEGRGSKLDRLKDVMTGILNDMVKGDLISIVQFNNEIAIWDIQSEEPQVISSEEFDNSDEPFRKFDEFSFPSPTFAGDATIIKAKNIVRSMTARSSAFHVGGLEAALYIIKTEQDVQKDSKYQPIIVYLTHGKENIGCDLIRHIPDLVTKVNVGHNNVPIFSVSIGEDANKTLVRVLSAKNYGLSKHIYEGIDSSVQLQSFYKRISSLLLKNVQFKYECNVTEVTMSRFPLYFKGSELVVSGKCTACELLSTINGCGLGGYLNFESTAGNSALTLERLWAYVTVKQLLEQRSTTDDREELTKRIIDLAVKHSFVTEVTPLVVVKPDEICQANLPLQDIIEDTVSEGTTGRRPVKRRNIRQKRKHIQPKTFMAHRPFFVGLVLKRADKGILVFASWIRRPS